MPARARPQGLLVASCPPVPARLSIFMDLPARARPRAGTRVKFCKLPVFLEILVPARAGTARPGGPAHCPYNL